MTEAAGQKLVVIGLLLPGLAGPTAKEAIPSLQMMLRIQKEAAAEALKQIQAADSK